MVREIQATPNLSSAPHHAISAPAEIRDAAIRYVNAGYSVLPIAGNGALVPDWAVLPDCWIEPNGRQHCTWEVFRTRRPADEEMNRWFGQSSRRLAAVCGKVSGGLEAMNFNTPEIFCSWADTVIASAPAALHKMVFVTTPHQGWHAYYRTESPAPTQVLARQQLPSATGVPTTRTVISLIGEGGYILVPPSVEFCDPRQQPYAYLQGQDLDQVQPINVQEREHLLAAARSLNTSSVYPPYRSGPHPGDIVDASITWDEILAPHGWARVQVFSDGSERWRRPNKNYGTSATIRFGGVDVLHVFSRKCPSFQAGNNYSKFAALAILNYDGDLDAAAEHLAKQLCGP